MKFEELKAGLRVRAVEDMKSGLHVCWRKGDEMVVFTNRHGMLVVDCRETQKGADQHYLSRSCAQKLERALD